MKNSKDSIFILKLKPIKMETNDRRFFKIWYKFNFVFLPNENYLLLSEKIINFHSQFCHCSPPRLSRNRHVSEKYINFQSMKENKEIKRRNYYQTIVGAHTRKTLTRKVVNTRGSKDRPVSIERTFTANFIACTAADIPMFFHFHGIGKADRSSSTRYETSVVMYRKQPP